MLFKLELILFLILITTLSIIKILIVESVVIKIKIGNIYHCVSVL